MGRTAEVQRDARVGEAEAHMQTTIAEAYAEEQRMESKLSNDTGIAHSKRDYDVKKAGYDIEVNTARAAADLAFELQVSGKIKTIGCKWGCVKVVMESIGVLKG